MRQQDADFAFVDDEWFQFTMAFVLLLNMITIGMETEFACPSCPRDNFNASILVDSCFTGIYVIEFGLKFAHYRFRCLQSWFQVFDASLVLVAVIDTWVVYFVFGNLSLRTLSILRVVRVVRLSRIIKFMMKQSELNMFLHSILGLHTILLPMCLVLAVVVYLTALVMSIVYDPSRDGWVYPSYARWSGQEYWGSLHSSMFTLFQVTTGDNWAAGVARPLIRVYPLYALIFIPFMGVMFYAFRAALIAKICDDIIQSGPLAEGSLHREETRIREILDELRENFNALKNDKTDSHMNFKQLENFCSIRANRKLLAHLNIPVSDLSELFYMLDCFRREAVDMEAFFASILRLTGPAMGRDVTSVHMRSHNILYRMSILSVRIAELENLIGDEIFPSLKKLAHQYGLTKSTTFILINNTVLNERD